MNPLRATPDDAADGGLNRLLGWVSDSGLELYPTQEEAVLALFDDHHVVITTPTGSGKSLVAHAAMLRRLVSGDRAVYTAPIKSLVSEKFFEMRALFGDDNVGMITGDVTINGTAPLICCTAEVVALQLLAGDFQVDTLVADEFHFVADPDRGWAWHTPLVLGTDTQFVLMSATLGDTTWLRNHLATHTSRDTVEITGTVRPVPLEFTYAVDTLIETVLDLRRNSRLPAYVVHFTQKAAAEQAQAFTSLDLVDAATRTRIAASLAAVRFDTPFGADLRRILSHGVGIHHAGMLPRYRLLVEKLAADGLLAVICGTDTLGVGINVPIRTVVLTQLCKYDGRKTRLLSVREFLQIAGRAGRRGFDSVGYVVGLAPAHVIENHKAEARARAEPSKRKKLVKRKPPERGYTHWDEATFGRLSTSAPETLVPQMTVSHSMVLLLLQGSGDDPDPLATFLDRCILDDKRRDALYQRGQDIMRSMWMADLVRPASGEAPPEPRVAPPPDETAGADTDAETEADRAPEEADPSPIDPPLDPLPDGPWTVRDTLPDDFALHQDLAPFMIEVVAAIDREQPGHALEVLSAVEATLDDPMVILLAQQDAARDELFRRLRAEGVDYETRQTLLADTTWPRPLADELRAMFATFSRHHPWAMGLRVHPKAIARTMLENGYGFSTFVKKLGIKRSEGLLVRYLSECAKALQRSIPDATDDVLDTAAWLETVVRRVDASLLDQWERLAAVDAAPPSAALSARAVRAAVRSELFRWVHALARADKDQLDAIRTTGPRQDWHAALDIWADAGTQIATDADARGPTWFEFDPVTGTAGQTVIDTEGEPVARLSALVSSDPDAVLDDPTGSITLTDFEAFS